MNQTSLLLEMKGIHKWFGKVHALNGVNLEVRKNEAVGIMGDNGAGKSTLIKILSGVLKKDEGEIYWKEKKVDISSVADARKLGIETVHQEPTIISSKSVAQNIFLGRELTKTYGGIIKLIDENRMNKEAEKLTNSLKLKIASPDQESGFCSGGEMQGIEVSRAIYFSSELLILDEPTTALSIAGVEQLYGMIEKMKKSKGRGLIVITHAIMNMYPICDRFVLLRHGKKVEDLEKKDVSLQKLKSLLIQ